MLRVPQSLGFLGGRPNHATFWIGTQGANEWRGAEQRMSSIGSVLRVRSVVCDGPLSYAFGVFFPRMTVDVVCHVQLFLRCYRCLYSPNVIDLAPVAQTTTLDIHRGYALMRATHK